MKFGNWDFFKKRSVRIWTAVIVIVLFIAGTVLLFFGLAAGMFTHNQRFTLRKVQVSSRGFWHGKKDLLCGILHVKPGLTNLFQLEPGKMRAELLQREPSIQYVKVNRVLPDTLEFSILERIPVALVNSPHSPLVVDSGSILMLRNRCMDITYSLPVIVGLPDASSYPPGGVVRKFERAVELIMLTKTMYPEIKIASISVVQNERLLCAVYYKNNFNEGEMFRVLMPDRDLSRNLRALITALETLRKSNSPKRNINLLFHNQAVITAIVPERSACS